MVRTRTTNDSIVEIDPEIERTFSRNLRQSLQDLVITSMMEQALRDLNPPDLTQQPLGVVVPPLASGVEFELDHEFIDLLPTFHGRPEEDSIMFVREFHDICV